MAIMLVIVLTLTLTLMLLCITFLVHFLGPLLKGGRGEERRGGGGGGGEGLGRAGGVCSHG